MQRTIDCGVVKYDRNEQRRKVTVELELRENKEGKPVFSACANVWNKPKTDVIICGQCFDDIHLYNPLYKTIKQLWAKYHLNDLHAGTPEQEECLRQHVDEHHWDYDKCCKVLADHNLYVVPLDGKQYRYGTAWLYRPIPDDDLALIKRIIETGQL